MKKITVLLAVVALLCLLCVSVLTACGSASHQTESTSTQTTSTAESTTMPDSSTTPDSSTAPDSSTTPVSSTTPDSSTAPDSSSEVTIDYNEPVSERLDFSADNYGFWFLHSEYNAAGNPVTRQYRNETMQIVDLGFWRYEYDETGKLLKLTMTLAEEESSFTILYDAKGFPVSATALYGKENIQVHFTCNEDGKILTENYYLGEETSLAYEFDENGRVIKEILMDSGDAYQAVSTHNGTESEVVLTEEDTEDTDTYHITYNAMGYPVRMVATNGEERGVILYEYNEKNLCVLVTVTVEDQEPENVWTARYEFSYDADGNMIKETYTSYDADSNITEREVDEYEYDADGNQIKETDTYYDADGKVTERYEYEYDADGKRIKWTNTDYDADGNVTEREVDEYEYDADGKRIKETGTYYDADGKVTGRDVSEYEYDADGNLIKETLTRYDADGKVTGWDVYEYEYDADGKRIKWTHTRYDADGNVIGKTEW